LIHDEAENDYKTIYKCLRKAKEKKKAMLPMEGSQGCEETLWATTAKELWLLVHKSSRNLISQYHELV
jgi:hypothetical protein